MYEDRAQKFGYYRNLLCSRARLDVRVYHDGDGVGEEGTRATIEVSDGLYAAGKRLTRNTNEGFETRL